MGEGGREEEVDEYACTIVQKQACLNAYQQSQKNYHTLCYSLALQSKRRITEEIRVRDIVSANVIVVNGCHALEVRDKDVQ